MLKKILENKNKKDLNKIIFEISTVSKKTLKAFMPDDIDTLAKIYEQLLSLIKSENAKLKLLENPLFAECDETILRSNFRDTLIAISNEKNSEHLTNLIQHLKNSESLSEAKYVIKANKIKEFAEQYKTISKEFNNLKKLQSRLGEIIDDRQQEIYHGAHAQLNSLDTRLHNAVKEGLIHDVKVLVSNGANVNSVDDGNMTPLHLAAMHGHVEIAKYLIEKNANPNAKTILGNKLLHLANTPEMTKYLLQLGMEMDEFNYRLETPLQRAIGEKRFKVATFLLENGANPNLKDGWGFSPLYSATSKGNKELMSLLVEKGAKINAHCSGKNTPLHGASIHAIVFRDGDMDIVKHLLNLGADKNAKNRSGETPLLWVALAKKFNLEGFNLLSTKENINSRNFCGATVLHSAIRASNFDNVRYLVERAGANVNAKNNYGNTPLHEAAELYDGVLERVQYLVKNGADATLVNMENKTPADLCRKSNIQAKNFLEETRIKQSQTKSDSISLNTVSVGRLFQNQIKDIQQNNSATFSIEPPKP